LVYRPLVKQEGSGQMTRDEMKELANRMYAALNAGNLDEVDAIYAADFCSHAMGATGTGAVKNAWAAVREKFPDLRVSVEDMIADGDKLAVRTVLHGTPADQAGEPRPILMEIIRIADGQITELWGVTNWR
jgi:predicted SnoaL-like aldol condensation-catalyzing enzyme